MKKFIISTIVIALGFEIYLGISMLPKAQELGTLASPVVQGNVTDYSITSIQIGRLPTWNLTICYQDNFARQSCDSHVGVVATIGPTGADILVKALNKANLSTQSLECRAILHLISEGKIPSASCTGSPQ